MNCREAQERLAEEGQQALGNPAVEAHLQGCPACRKMRERLERVDQALSDLEPVEPSANVIERTHMALDRLGAAKKRAAPRRKLRLVLALGTPLVLVLAGVVLFHVRELASTSANALAGGEPAEVPDRFANLVMQPPDRGDRAQDVGRYTLGPPTTIVTKGRGKAGGKTTWRDEIGLEVASRSSGDGVDANNQHGWYATDTSSPANGVEKKLSVDKPAEKLVHKRERTFPIEELDGDEEDTGVSGKKDEKKTAETIDRSELLGVLSDTTQLSRQTRIVPSVKDGKPAGFELQGVRPGSTLDRMGLKNGDVIRGVNEQPIDVPDKALEAYSRLRDAERLELDVDRDGERKKLTLRIEEKNKARESNEESESTGEDRLHIDTTPSGSQVFIDGRQVNARRWQDIELPPGTYRVRLNREGHYPLERDVTVQEGEMRRLDSVVTDQPSLDALEFIPASGYFANTYLPGDPRLAWLKSQLSDELFLDGRALALEQAAVPYRQPFDPPAREGLAVYLHADRARVEGRQRLTLQVGLKGSERHARRRGALHAVLVVDLRDPPGEEARRVLWKLAQTLASDQQAGDRFHLVAAGPGEPEIVDPGRFGPNTVRSALARMLERRLAEPAGQGGDLGAALEKAYGLLRGEGAEQAPLGANLVVLATAARLEPPAESLLDRVHQAALDGISLTAIGAGEQPGMQALGQLARAGQGRRRLVRSVDEAGRVLQEELSASGRVVARAVRLRIRLAEGVKLVEVLGSSPLDAAGADRVRQAEQAVDRRVARTLGIQADRGEDEDGIQVVIPVFYAGDDHVILLDVVVPGPGPVADVRVRYKDLVNLNNAVARASLRLPAGGGELNPLVLNVHKNVLAYWISRDLLHAAGELEAGRADAARHTLARAEGRIAALRASNPAFADDRELQRDIAMLAAYQQVLQDEPVWRGSRAVHRHLVLSLAYAGRVKLPPGAPR